MSISIFPVPSSGIPSGGTSNRPSNPLLGDTFYNGELAILEIYDGNNWIACSALPAAPSITVSDIGTSIAYGSAQGTVTFSQNVDGGIPLGYTVSATTGGYSATTTGTTVVITVGNNGSYTFNGTAYNDYGISVLSSPSTQTLTTVPQAPTIGTATTSGTSTDVTVTWTLNSDGGKNLSSITITPYLDGTTAGTSQTAATTSSTSHVFTGLTSNSSYTFKVKTANANGDSLESSATNSITVPELIAIDYMVLAGGGGGHQANSNNDYPNTGKGGGGGGGGLRSTVTATGGGASLESAINLGLGANYTVTVGAGGAAATQGSQSVFANITSTGGGRGGPEGTAGNGGSGGGATYQHSAGGGFGGSGTTGQGFSGQDRPYDPNFSTNQMAGGYGGGAGSAGANAGLGLTVNISGNAVIYGGGGAPGTFSGGASAGNNGGGNGGGYNFNNAVSVNSNGGAINRGGGGGGGGPGTKTGGSGVVIIQYPSNRTATVGAGLTSSENTSGSVKIRTFNAGTGNVSFA